MRFNSSSLKAICEASFLEPKVGHSLHQAAGGAAFVLARDLTCVPVMGHLVGRMSASGSNPARFTPKATQEIAICRKKVVPPGWIEQPTPGLGNLPKA
ncbi:MAG TPA: hypothetical protein VFH61_06055 [Thermoleophilia bacterium]|nr:hypothetical protein [Thermoleophilia bacterium]